MVETSDRRLRWWAISAMVIVGILAVLPRGMFKNLTDLLEAPTVTNYIVETLISGAILFLVLGFYFRMLFECGFRRDVRHRGAWLTLLILVPLVSAFIYYWITRSSYYTNRFIRIP
jgi:hypothetical protein